MFNFIAITLLFIASIEGSYKAENKTLASQPKQAALGFDLQAFAASHLAEQEEIDGTRRRSTDATGDALQRYGEGEGAPGQVNGEDQGTKGLPENSEPISSLPEVQYTEAPPQQREPFIRGGDSTGIAEVVCTPEFTWSCDWALAVIQCESGGDPNAIGIEFYNGQWLAFIGWFQVLNGSRDPYRNAVEAHIKYVAWQRGQVARPWPNCP